MSRPDRAGVLALLRRIQDSRLGRHLILGGSPGMYGVSETIPALTEDVDVLVDAEWVAAQAAGYSGMLRGLEEGFDVLLRLAGVACSQGAGAPAADPRPAPPGHT